MNEVNEVTFKRNFKQKMQYLNDAMKTAKAMGNGDKLLLLEDIMKETATRANMTKLQELHREFVRSSNPLTEKLCIYILIELLKICDELKNDAVGGEHWDRYKGWGYLEISLVLRYWIHIKKSLLRLKVPMTAGAA